jgi:SnoaL-like domain
MALCDAAIDTDGKAARRLADRQEIAELCVRYTTALDTRDWGLLETCFAPAPVFVHPGGWKITERIQAYLWRDGNRAVIAR